MYTSHHSAYRAIIGALFLTLSGGSVTRRLAMLWRLLRRLNRFSAALFRRRLASLWSPTPPKHLPRPREPVQRIALPVANAVLERSSEVAQLPAHEAGVEPPVSRRPFWLLLALGLPAVAVPILHPHLFQATALRSVWLLFLVAQGAGLLNSPNRARRAVHHPFPRWYFWLIQLSAATGQLVLCVAWQGSPYASLESRGAIGAIFQALALSLATTALPYALSYLSHLLNRFAIALVRGRPRQAQSTPSSPGPYPTPPAPAPLPITPKFSVRPWHSYIGVFTILLLLICISLQANSIDTLFPLLPFFAVSLAPSRRLWRRSSPLWSAVPPQATALLLLAVVAHQAWDSFIPEVGIAPAGTLLPFVVSELFTFLRNLRSSPVVSLPTSPGARKNSVSRASRYVDSRGLAGYLRRSIAQSDRGVIGVTGVRGTGKSALLEHVLATLKPYHFVLLVTAPIRNDGGIGFLSTVCRAVCRRVLDDMNRVLYGRQTDGYRARSEIARRVGLSALVILLIASGALLLEQEMTSRSVVTSKPAHLDGPCSQVRARENELVSDLGAQIGAIERAPVPLYPQYALLPTRRSYLFLLAPAYGAGEQINWQMQQGSDPIAPWASTLSYCFDGLEHRLLVRHVMFLRRRLFPERPVVNQDALLSTSLSELFLHQRSAPLLDASRLHDFAALLRTYGFILEGQTVRSISRDEPTITRANHDPLFATEVAGAAASVVLLVMLTEFIWPKMSALLRLLMNWRYAALYREASDFLELLQYSERRDSSGSLAWRGLSWKRSRSLAARDLTLPGLTAYYTDFVQSARRFYNGKIVVAIDEVDKIHDVETVKALFSEIKGALFSPGTFYLISISSDATRSFRQRLAAGRDIFESTFDDVVETGQMGVEAAAAMIGRLPAGTGEVRVPEPCYFALTLMGGGIPREILRYLDKLSRSLDEPARATPDLVAVMIVRTEVRDWRDHLAELPLPGGEVIALRTEAGEALGALDLAPPSRATYDRAWSRLENCVALLDPGDLRLTAGAPEGSGKGDAAEQERRYSLVEDAVKGCLRLAIMTTVCKLIWRNHEWSETELAAVLEAHRALADKPAVAEQLLRQLRARVGESSPGATRHHQSAAIGKQSSGT
jgi:hypothetical protein